MLEQDVLKHPAGVLTEAQRRRFFEDGFLVVRDHVGAAWLARLREAMMELVERSRTVGSSDAVFKLEVGHSPERPRLHRVTNPQDHHPAFWEFFTDPVMTGLAADLVGPDVKFHHAKLNVKADHGSQGFLWHQDIPGWPHTDFSPVTIGVYLDGCTEEQGPLAFIRGTHKEPLFPLYDDDGRVTAVPEERLRERQADLRLATGTPGSVVAVNCRVVHGSSVNRSSRARPLLLPVYSSADSFPYTPSPLPTPRMGDIVRGQPARYACFDPRPVRVPPDFRAGFSGPWVGPAKPAAPSQTY